MDAIDLPAALARVPEAAARKGTTTDDLWLHAELPAILRARKPAYLTGAELSRVMRWKLATGKNRPNLQAFVDALTDAAVREASAAAFAALPAAGGAGLKAALEALAKPLKGVGPATASAVLAAWQPARCAFMSDEALELVVGSRKYTAAEGAELAARCAAKAKQLGGGAWTAQAVQRAVWAAQVLRAQGGGGGGGGSSSGGGSGGGGGGAAKGKRRREE